MRSVMSVCTQGGTRLCSLCGTSEGIALQLVCRTTLYVLAVHVTTHSAVGDLIDLICSYIYTAIFIFDRPSVHELNISRRLERLYAVSISPSWMEHASQHLDAACVHVRFGLEVFR